MSDNEMKIESHLPETIEGLEYLSKLHRDRFADRNREMWRILYAVFAFYGLILWQALEHPAAITICAKWLVSASFVAVWAGTTLFLLRGLLGHHRDLNYAHWAEKKLAERCGLAEGPWRKDPPKLATGGREFLRARKITAYLIAEVAILLCVTAFAVAVLWLVRPDS